MDLFNEIWNWGGKIFYYLFEFGLASLFTIIGFNQAFSTMTDHGSYLSTDRPKEGLLDWVGNGIVGLIWLCMGLGMFYIFFIKDFALLFN